MLPDCVGPSVFVLNVVDGCMETDYLLAIAAIVFAMMLGLPAIGRHTNRMFTHNARSEEIQSVSDELDIFTGRVPMREAVLQILLIPGALTFLATTMAAIYSAIHA